MKTLFSILSHFQKSDLRKSEICQQWMDVVVHYLLENVHVHLSTSLTDSDVPLFLRFSSQWFHLIPPFRAGSVPLLLRLHEPEGTPSFLMTSHTAVYQFLEELQVLFSGAGLLPPSGGHWYLHLLVQVLHQDQCGRNPKENEGNTGEW